MQRIFNIEKWTLVPEGKAIQFAGDRPREIRLDVNCPGTANLYLVTGEGSSFLARVTGRDTVEFLVDGSFGVASTGSDTYVYTVDGDKFTWENWDGESFAVVRAQRERNYEMERILATMTANLNRRLEIQANEIAAAMERRIAAGRTQPPAESLVGRVHAPDAASSSDGGEEEEPRPAGKQRGRPRARAAEPDSEE